MQVEELRALYQQRRLTKKEKEIYQELWKESGLSKRSFCGQEGLSLSTFSGWFKKKLKEDCSISNFISLSLAPKEIKKAITLKFSLPNGISIEGSVDLSEVKEFIRVLSDAVTTLC